MATPPKPPQFVGTPSDATDPNLKKQGVRTYAEGVKERNAEKLANAAPGPSIAGADVAFDPKRDGPRTIAQISAAHTAISEAPAPPSDGTRLSDVTTAGLKEVHAAAARANEAATTQPKPEASFVPAEEPETPSRARSVMSEMDDLSLERLMNYAAANAEDVINNQREREAVEKRLEPVDIIAGITTGEFTQDVPIVPGTFVVRYRAVTPEEEHAIRLILLDLTAKDAKLIALEASIYQMLTLAAGIARINGESMPMHYVRNGFRIETTPDVLKEKLKYFLSFPLAMTHALGTHQYWFDQRVRKAFTSADLGNG